MFDLSHSFTKIITSCPCVYEHSWNTAAHRSPDIAILCRDCSSCNKRRIANSPYHKWMFGYHFRLVKIWFIIQLKQSFIIYKCFSFQDDRNFNFNIKDTQVVLPKLRSPSPSLPRYKSGTRHRAASPSGPSDSDPADPAGSMTRIGLPFGNIFNFCLRIWGIVFWSCIKMQWDAFC